MRNTSPDRSEIRHTIGPASPSPYPSQHETDRADRRDPTPPARRWQKPPHILWRRLRAILIPGAQADDAYGSSARYEYAKEAAPSSWMYGVAIVLALLALVCATLSSGLFSKRDDRVALALQSATGTITGAQPGVAPDASIRTMPSQATLPSASPSSTPSLPSSPVASLPPSQTLQASSPSSPSPSQTLPNAKPARPVARVVTRPRDEASASAPAAARPHVEAALQSARANMDKNNLTTARAALSKVLVAQPNNVDAIKLNADLEEREFKRNAILLAARSCAAQDQWTCVWRNAGNALVIDASSVEAKQLVTQAMLQSELDARTGATRPPQGVKRAP
jgi:hypothetical protein